MKIDSVSQKKKFFFNGEMLCAPVDSMENKYYCGSMNGSRPFFFDK